MALFVGEKRGPQWKQGWRGRTLSSLSLPPVRLIAVFAIVVLLLALSGYVDYKARVHDTMVGVRIILVLLPVALIFAVRSMVAHGRLAVRLPRAEPESIHRAGSSPWGVAALVAVLLLMVSYQSSFHSQWFRPLWRSG